MKFSHLNGSYHHHHHSVYLSHVCWSEFSEQMISLQSLRLRSDITFASGVLNVDYKTLEIPKDPNFRSKNKFNKKNFHKTKELQADFQQFARSLMFWQVQNDESKFQFFTECSRDLPDNQQKVFKFLPP